METSRKRSTSLLQTLYKDLGEIIAQTPHGERLPSEPELAQKFGVSRATLREAISKYENQGLIQKRHGVGTFVVHPSRIIESGLEVLDTIECVAERNNLSMRTSLLKVITRPAEDDEAEKLRIPARANVVQVTRVMEVKFRPVAYMIDVLPEGLLKPDELGEDFNGSVLELLLKRENLLGTSYTEIRPGPASSKVAHALDIPTGEIILRLVSTIYDPNDRIVYLSDDAFLPSDFRFHVLRRVERFHR